MNIKAIFILIFFFYISLTNAQKIGVGLKGGINYNYIGDFYSIGGSIGPGVLDEYYSAENEISYQLGVFVDISFDNFFIRPEANYVSLKNSYKFPTKPAQWESQQIDIPILFGYKVYSPIAIYAGPVFSFISDRTLEGWQDTSYADPFVFNTSSAGISAGILIDFGRVGIDFRYQYGLTTVKEQRLDMIKTYDGYGVNLGDLLEYNPSQIMINIQIKLFSVYTDKQHRRSNFEWRNHKNL
ncbi:Outer membrane protein beta-barrel domain-containing protein [Lutibacter agarilyticus]|uniref:Outer membrane protein beta-barrel domain-containing protein n=1 Tax=Lutibacter agarilyticus TaxID=1109740 RepID=A0A238VHH8_9FLAO|nr:porin family protein [Lutibacter agarilyticus]SNR33624.1 Outer membrane protein beta-barrel domain-containing protein [Lutibacter agarilyticus]